MSILYQTGCTVIVCFTSLITGLMYAWPSSTVKIFSSANTTLHRPMYEMEIALFGSLSSIGALVSTPLSALLLDNLGRKYTCILSSTTQVVSWAIVVVSNRVEAIPVTSFISGLGGNCFLVVPVFVSEICQDSIRGTMTSGSVIAFSLGILISYIFGGCLEYNNMIYTCLFLSVAGVIMLLPLKESPLFLTKKGLKKDAAKAIAFYRCLKVDSKELLQEMNEIRMALSPDLESIVDLTSEVEKLNQDAKSHENMSKYEVFKKSRSTRRALFVVLILYTAIIFQGLAVLQVYAKPLFEETIPSMSATLSSALLAILSIVANCVAAYLIDIVGRRALIIYPSIGAGVSCLILGSEISKHWGAYWINGIFIYLFIITHTCASGTVPAVLVSEVFLPEIKSLMSMICVQWAWICNFTILFFFNPLVSAIDLRPVFYIFAGICFGTAVFYFFFLPETNLYRGYFLKNK